MVQGRGDRSGDYSGPNVVLVAGHGQPDHLTGAPVRPSRLLRRERRRPKTLILTRSWPQENQLPKSGMCKLAQLRVKP